MKKHGSDFKADIQQKLGFEITFVDVALNEKKPEETSPQSENKENQESHSSVPKILKIGTTPMRLIFAGILCFVFYSQFHYWAESYGIAEHILPYCYAAMVIIVISVAISLQCKGILCCVRDIPLIIAAAYLIWAMVQIIYFARMDISADQKRLSIYTVIFCILVIFAVSGRLRLSIILNSSFWFLLSVANYFVYTFRGEVLLFGDLVAIGTAFDVAKGYTYEINGDLFAGALVFVSILAIAFHTNRKIKKGLNRFILQGSVAVVCLACFAFFLFDNSYTEYYYSWIPINNEYIYAFAVNVKALHIPKPEDYSPDKTAEILDQYKDSEESQTAQKPVVIAIMGETFSDPSTVGAFSTDKSYLDYYNSLSENTIKGNVYTEVFGAGTCDSEYAFLTGNTTAYVPPNARPYLLYVNGTTPNLATTLNSQGYDSHVLHSGAPSSWNRNNVFNYFGFSDFHTQYSMIDGSVDCVMIRNRISDYTSYQKLIQVYENHQDELPFIFEVTIANHGGYDQLNEEDEEIDRVHLLGLKGYYPLAEEYLSLMRKSDQDLRTLIQYFEKVSRPVIICYFGDHQANVEEAFYEEIAGKPMSEWTPEEQQKRYCTPFFIWANYDIPEADNVSISLNYLSGLLLQTAGLEMPTYNRYLLQLSEKLPIISSKGVKDEKGNYYALDDAGKYADEIKNFRIVNYNNLFDVRHRLNQYYYIPNSEYLDENNNVKTVDKHYTIDGN